MLQIGVPVPVHGRPLQKPTSYESSKTHLGNRKNPRALKNAKVVLACFGQLTIG